MGRANVATVTGDFAASFAGGRLTGRYGAKRVPGYSGDRVKGGLGLQALLASASISEADDLTASTVGLVFDDNLLNFNEGVSTTGWSISSGTGTLSQASSSVRLTSSAAAVTADLALAGPTANDFFFMLNVSAKYVAGQYSTLRLIDGVTAVLDISLGYDHVAGSATLGTISALRSGVGAVIATGLNYETTPQTLIVHIDRNYSAVNLYLKEPGGKWNFTGSYSYAAAFSSLDVVQLVTSAHSGQWVEYDWCGYARPNIISIGDSICAGHTGFDPDPAYYAGVDSYANSWQKHATLAPTLRNNLIVNKGVGGESSTQILARIGWVTANSPRLMILHSSTNDYVLAVSKSTRQSNIQTCIDAATGIGASVWLLNAMYGTSSAVYNPAHRDYMDDWWTNASYRAALTGVSKAINIMTPMDSGSNYMSAALTEGDNIHPTAAGYQAIGAHILAA